LLLPLPPSPSLTPPPLTTKLLLNCLCERTLYATISGGFISVTQKHDIFLYELSSVPQFLFTRSCITFSFSRDKIYVCMRRETIDERMSYRWGPNCLPSGDVELGAEDLFLEWNGKLREL
ncbi:hypothetical protein V1478_008318, partial [Vespula squamosa]